MNNEPTAAPTPVPNPRGGYAYLPGLTFASNGVIALPGHSIERAVLDSPSLLPEGYEVIRQHLERVQRPLSALCGVELRSPATLPVQGFRDFNEGYRGQLAEWSLLDGSSVPLTRTNVVPVAGAPTGPAVVAFSYTTSRPTTMPSFVISGAAEVPDDASYPDGIVRPNDTGAAAMAEKVRTVVRIVETRVSSLGTSWDDAASVHLYSTHPAASALRRVLLEEIGVAPLRGIVWHDAAPPVEDLALEIDVRRYDRELSLPTA